MELYASGFNAWGQLDFESTNDTEHDEPHDLHTFQRVCKDDHLSRPQALLSCTLGMVSHLHRHHNQKNTAWFPADNTTIGAKSAHPQPL